MVNDVISILKNALQIGNAANSYTRETVLIGNIPEFDSMAVISVITAMEENYNITVEDDEISADLFETVGTLADFLATKVNA